MNHPSNTAPKVKLKRGAWKKIDKTCVFFCHGTLLYYWDAPCFFYDREGKTVNNLFNRTLFRLIRYCNGWWLKSCNTKCWVFLIHDVYWSQGFILHGTVNLQWTACWWFQAIYNWSNRILSPLRRENVKKNSKPPPKQKLVICVFPTPIPEMNSFLKTVSVRLGEVAKKSARMQQT